MCAKDIELCYDHNCMHKYVLKKQYYRNMNLLDKWKGKESRAIPFSYCDHDKHLLAIRSPSWWYERN